jgi:pyruvate/2-oxoglutarate/acetoin dehydrogenase E1 component|tara:strand:- start:150 stop:686 length:537 start_codon:yes stop_codon:yes gene_type:complete
MKYFDELKKSMNFLSKNKKVIFIGQAVQYPGTAMFNTLNETNKNKRFELPVAEEMQMGITIGLAMNGHIPVSIYPRWNFLLLASNQIINHLDKISLMSKQKFNQKIIIRTAIGSKRPIHPQHQHVGDFTSQFSKMCKNIDFIKLRESKDIFQSYKKALMRKDNKPTVLIEYGDYYNEK